MSQVVLITGAGSGIGKTSALLLAERGYIVYAGTRTPEQFDINVENLHVIQLDIIDEYINNHIDANKPDNEGNISLE